MVRELATHSACTTNRLREPGKDSTGAIGPMERGMEPVQISTQLVEATLAHPPDISCNVLSYLCLNGVRLRPPFLRIPVQLPRGLIVGMHAFLRGPHQCLMVV